MSASLPQSAWSTILGAVSGNGKRLRAAAVSTSCPTCHGLRLTFSCPRWPACGCPEGTIAPSCPGKSIACTCDHIASGIC